jgi:hypothetical protein
MVCGPVDCFRQFCDVAKSGDDLQRDLANFGYYKLNMKVKFVKHTVLLLLLFGYPYLNHVLKFGDFS